VIVRCERCETRFKLDESRLPARGARVRCSRCKHAFFVIPPGASREQLVHDVAAHSAATASAAHRTPGATWDLDEGNRPPAPAVTNAKATASPAAETEDENDWRFEDDVPIVEASAAEASLDLTGSVTAPPSFLAAPEANEDSFADLGDPETWDLLSDDGPAPTPTSTPRPTPGSAPARPAFESAAPIPVAEPVPAPAPAARAVEPVLVETTPIEAAPSPVPTVRSAPPTAARQAPAVRAAGWAAAAALSALVAGASLSIPASTPITLAPIAGFDVTEARTRIVDNATTGPLLVVSGRLRNPGPAPRTLGAPLRLQLLDAAGAPIAGASAFAGPTLSTRRVREEAPEQLRSAQDAGATELASQPVAAGAELSFDAVFGPPPSAAARVAIAAAGTPPES
jgi:predicted Zn finger-like uncharacterized protein